MTSAKEIKEIEKEEEPIKVKVELSFDDEGELREIILALKENRLGDSWCLGNDLIEILESKL